MHATIELEPKLVVCVHSTRKACRRQVYCFTVQVQTQSNRSWKRLRFKHAPCHAAARHEFGENALAPEIEASIWLLLHIDDLVAREPHRVILALQCPTVSGNARARVNASAAARAVASQFKFQLGFAPFEHLFLPVASRRRRVVPGMQDRCLPCRLQT